MSADELLLEQRIRLGSLLDRYELLLTERQSRACQLLLHQDLSFTELADQLGVTRQGAFDLVRRARDQMEDMEKSLGVLELHRRQNALIRYIDRNHAEFPATILAEMKKLLEESASDV